MPPEAIFDVATLDFGRIVADREGIRSANPQRFEMEQLDAILVLDKEQKLVIGYRDVAEDEFWVRGHMPGYPLLPGVLMCEMAAQLCSYYTTINRVTSGDFLGFGGLENVRFRGTVRPGDRFVMVAKAQRLSSRHCIFNCQGFVGGTMVFQGDIFGLPMKQPASGDAAEEP